MKAITPLLHFYGRIGEDREGGIMKIGTQGSVLRSIQTLFSVGSVGGMTDGELLEEFLSRRDELAEAAFAALVALHGPMVWSICQSVLPDSTPLRMPFRPLS